MEKIKQGCGVAFISHITNVYYLLISLFIFSNTITMQYILINKDNSITHNRIHRIVTLLALWCFE